MSRAKEDFKNHEEGPTGLDDTRPLKGDTSIDDIGIVSTGGVAGYTP